MASRVAIVALTSAALGGLAAACVAIFAVDRLISHQADQRLYAATVTLAGEFDEDRNDRKPDSVIETIDDENDEIATSGIRLAVFQNGELLAGDTWIFTPAPHTCDTRSLASERVRACAFPYEAWVLVAAQPIDESWLYWVYAFAAAGSVVLGAGSGAISSFGLTRWAVGPLLALSKALRQSRAEAPGALDLGSPSDCVEVEAIRVAVRDLTLRLQVLLDQAHRFAADAAHELRTPLTALRAELELLSEEIGPRDAPAIERASLRTAQLSELLDRLLVLALPTENLSEGFEAVAVADIVEEVVRELPHDQAARVELELASEGLVRGDPHLLTSLVVNALKNALKFAATGPVTIRVEECNPNGSGLGEVALRVSDTGPGVPEELRGRVFEPFYRARPEAATGYGLGLALIGHIARAHAGEALFEDSERGARLLIKLPSWSESVESNTVKPE